MARVRKNVWTIESDPNDKTLEWYGKAVAAMQARSITEHRSWRFQAAIHGYEAAEDPFFNPNETILPTSERRRLWNQCQHGSWFFLPWHRMYLHHFEQICRAEIIAAGGPADWALPYWNYSAGDATRLLPPSFRNPTLANNQRNPLFVRDRDPNINGGSLLDPGDVDIARCLASPDFASSPFDAGFGGPETGFSHLPSSGSGTLEQTPHGLVHGAVGGFTGWMGSFNTAALDPIFWLHHANIDRLWDVWLGRSASHKNPTSPFWTTRVAFPFKTVDGVEMQMTVSSVLDAAAAPLDYRYDDVSDPLPGLESVASTNVSTAKRIPEMVRATHAPFELSESVERAEVPTAPLTSPSNLESVAGEPPKRVYLRIENLTCGQRAPAYDVYLGLPAGADPKKHPENLVGRLPMFGLAEASKLEGPHAGSGLTFALEVTKLVEKLSQEPGWDPVKLPVSFVPVRETNGARVRVGRVSLYVG